MKTSIPTFLAITLALSSGILLAQTSTTAPTPPINSSSSATSTGSQDSTDATNRTNASRQQANGQQNPDQLFQQLDKDNNGSLSREEFKMFPSMSGSNSSGQNSGSESGSSSDNRNSSSDRNRSDSNSSGLQGGSGTSPQR